MSLGWTVWAWVPWYDILNASNENLRLTVAIALFFIFLTLLIVSYCINRFVYLPIGGEPRVIESLVRRVASGDLSSDIKTKGNETGVYAQVLVMIENLRKTVGGINRTAISLSSSSKDMIVSAADVHQSSHRQMERLEQTATAMNQMTMTVDEVACSAQAAADSANQAHNSAEHGQNVVAQMNSDMS